MVSWQTLLSESDSGNFRIRYKPVYRGVLPHGVKRKHGLRLYGGCQGFIQTVSSINDTGFPLFVMTTLPSAVKLSQSDLGVVRISCIAQ